MFRQDELARNIRAFRKLRGLTQGELAGRLFVTAGKDKTRDQSYFLWALSQKQLANTLFPLGDYTKEQVRER